MTAWEALSLWDRLHPDLLRLLKQAGRNDTDKNPTDCGRKGTKHTLLLDRSESMQWILRWLGVEPHIARR